MASSAVIKTTVMTESCFCSTLFRVGRVYCDFAAAIFASVFLKMETTLGANLQNIIAALSLASLRDRSQAFFMSKEATEVALGNVFWWPSLAKTLFAITLYRFWHMWKLVSKFSCYSQTRWFLRCQIFELGSELYQFFNEQGFLLKLMLCFSFDHTFLETLDC